MSQIQILSWNVNGFRSVLKKDFLTWFKKTSPDILCLQETKVLPSQLAPEVMHMEGYTVYLNPATRPGYSGVFTFSKQKPLSFQCGFGIPKYDHEGRLLQTDYENFTLFNVYFPNGKMGPDRLRYKMEFYDQSLKYFMALRKKGKKLVICGDVNTAHKEIDLARPKENSKISGFLPEERAWMDRFVAAGFIDTFRVFEPGPQHYSWWDIRTGARKRNIGWRIDYHFISEDLKPNLKDAFILPEVMGSDHCPVGILLKF